MEGPKPTKGIIPGVSHLDLAFSKLIAYISLCNHNYIVAKHNVALAEYLEAVERGDITRLMIFEPPRHGKTYLASQSFPAWYLGRNPDKQIIATTYSNERSNDVGREVRNQMLDPLHHSVFPQCTISSDSKSMSKLSTNQGGNYFSVGTLGAITGRGANCCVGETLVETNHGSIKISELHKNFVDNKNVKVLSMDKDGILSYNRVIATRKVLNEKIYDVSIGHGISVKATGGHRFYVLGKGFLEAQNIQRGDRLVISREAVHSMREKIKQTLSVKRTVPGMLSRITKTSREIYLCLLSYRKHEATSGCKEGDNKRAYRSLLFSKMFQSTSCYQESQTMCCLRETNSKKNSEILLSGVPIKSQAWEKWSRIFQIQTSSFYAKINSRYNRKRWLSLRSLRQKICDGALPTFKRNAIKKKPLCPPYRPKQKKQRTEQFDNIMQFLPCADPQRCYSSVVTKVTKYCEEEHYVYDIQVAKNANFFVNSVLCHNCFIIDDPVKGREDADSKTVQRKIQDWFTSVAYTRLMEHDSAIVLIMCVAKGERVLMGDGSWQPIETVRAGDFVIGYDGKQPVRKKVLKTMAQGEDDIVEVISRSCSLKVNKKHPFLVVKGGLKISAKTQADVVESRKWKTEWVCAGDLKPGDSVVTIKKLSGPSSTGPGNYGTGDIKRNDDKVSSRRMNKDDFWLLGFMFGDGWLINNGKRGIVGFCIAASDKPELDKYVLMLVKRIFNIKMTLTSVGYYRADAKKIGRWLSKRGLCSGAHEKRVPEWMYKISPSYKSWFLRGFFAADGCETSPKSYSVCLCNKELLDDLRLLSRTCGFRCSKIYKYSGVSQPPNSPKPKLFTQYLCRFADKNQKTEWRTRYRYQSNVFSNRFRIEDVEKIIPAGKKEVYDLTVEGVESFVAEGFVVHNTRWSYFDLAGYLLNEKANENWVVLNLPAIAEEDNDVLGRNIGDPLWPQKFDKLRLGRIRDTIGTRDWNSLYQQRPTPMEGGMIKLEDIQRYDATDFTAAKIAIKMGVKKPNYSLINKNGDKILFKKIVCSWDTAFKEADINDPSACTVWGITENNFYLIDVFNKRLDFPKLKSKTIELHAYWQKFVPMPVSVLIEDKASGQSLIQELRKFTRIPIIAIQPEGNKVVRMDEVAVYFEGKKVYFPERAKWLHVTETQLERFPYDKHDDICDSMSQFLRWAGSPRYVKSKNPGWWK